MIGRLLIISLLTSACLLSYSMDRLPIHEAAIHGDADAVTRILDEDPMMINKPEDLAYGFTPLHWAAMKRHKNVVRVLLKRGADISIRDGCEGYKPGDFIIVRRVALELAKERELMHQAQLALLMGGHARLGANSSLQAIHNMLPQIAQYLRSEDFQEAAVQAASRVKIPIPSMFTRARDAVSDLSEIYYILKHALGY